jgi:class 3 adenylate cyclase/tetratricopeptide (TPR) repeat protein
VYERLHSGQGQFLTELRPVVALFLAFSGIDYDGDDAAGEKLDAFIRWLQGTIARYDGSLLQLTMGDKGSYTYIAFGAPIAHEDDAIRAVGAALEMRSPPAELSCVRGIQIGISYGPMRTGETGGATRRIYGVMGNEANVAARLMSRAQAGQILATKHVAEAGGDAFDFQELESLILKGLAKPLGVFEVRDRLRAPTARGLKRRTPIPLVGREEERAILLDQLQALRAGRSGCLIIEGEAGIGKSRLVDFLDQQAQSLGVTSLIGAGDAIEKATAYHAWRPIFLRWANLELPGEDATGETREAWRAHVLARVEQAGPHLARLAPLLNAVLPLELPDNDLTEHMTGEVRANNTHELLIGLLNAAARSGPLLVVLEDAHWLDSVSWALTRLVSRSVQPALLVIVTRPLTDPAPGEYTYLHDAAETRRLSLDTLSPAEIEAVISQRLGVKRLPQPVTELIRLKAEGHPFFSEELAYALRDTGLIQIVDGECRIAPGVRDLRALDFPDTIQGVITSRFDHLAPEHQLTVKVASAIGRLFAFRVVRDIYPLESDRPGLLDHLDALQRLDITPLETPEPDLTYIFKHIITQEVAYNLMTFSQRRQLHRAVAEWYERAYAGDPAPYYSLLAHHWRQAIDDPRDEADVAAKTIDYLEKAGQQALHRNANREAIYFFDEALALDAQLGSGDRRLQRARLHFLRGEAHNRLGQARDSQADYEEALTWLGRPAPASSGRMTASLLRQSGRQALHRLWPSRYLGRARGEAAAVAQEAARAHAALTLLYYIANNSLGLMNSTLCALNQAETVGPSSVSAEGYATMCVIMGTLSRHEWAEAYARMALEVAGRLKDPLALSAVLVRIGLYRLTIGQWAQARTAVEQAIAHYHEINDQRAWGDSVNLLIRLLFFHGEYREGLELARTLVAAGKKTENAQHEAWGRGLVAENLTQLGSAEQAVDVFNTLVAEVGEGSTDNEKYAFRAARAFACLRAGHLAEALELAGPALDWMLRMSPSIYAVQSAYFRLAEVYLTAWDMYRQQALTTTVDPASLAGSARRACKALRTFARTNPFGRPAAWLCQGQLENLSGNPSRARSAWRKGLALAEKLDMPYEQGRLHDEIGQNLPATDPARREHLRRASDLFTQLGASADLARARTALEQS